jgi:hypothetical protein
MSSIEIDSEIDLAGLSDKGNDYSLPSFSISFWFN